MRRRGSAIFATALLAIAGGTVAKAETLIVSVSNQRITVTSNYSGEELVLFGSVERDGSSRPPGSPYDIVVTVSGPRINMVTRRKERKFGMWVNADSREFIHVPAYLGIFANRPIGQIVSSDTQAQQQIGMDRILLPQQTGPEIANAAANDPFRAAFIRLQESRELYREDAHALTFITPTLFRTSIPLPAEVPTGTYTIDIKLFADGNLVTRTDTSFDIVKVGFEQFVAEAARQHSLLYGLATVLVAMMLGWLAAVVFRKD